MSFLEKQRQEGRKTLALILAVAAVFIIYTQYTARAVPLPEAHFDALRQSVPEGRLSQGLMDARRSGSSYVVHVTEVAPDGRRVTYTYEIDEEMNVSEKGMTVGYGGPNPLNTVLALLLGCALLSYAIFIFARQLFSPRCPYCRHILGFEFLTLYSGGLSASGDGLPPIVLRSAKCNSCDYVYNKVSVPGDFRPTSAFAAAFARTPYLDEKVLELQQKMKDELHVTEEEWHEMLRKFKAEYEASNK